MIALDRAWSFLQRPDIEGGSKFVDDPDDPGGKTRWGVSQRAYPAEDIEHMTEARAKELFARDYWTPCRCDQLPERVAIAVADAAFNQGARTAVVLLQEALRVEPDGLIGTKTLAAAKARPEAEVVNEFLSRRLLRYADGKAKYRRGWFLRVLRLKDALSAV
jgi:lysozyme family protein